MNFSVFVPNAMSVKDPTSALGEALGDLMEERIGEILKKSGSKHGCFVDTHGKRKGVRERKTLKLEDAWGISHGLDFVVEDSEEEAVAGNPLAVIESKFLKDAKHNWDKGSRLAVAHYNLERTYPTLNKSVAVLAGIWTDNSLDMIRSFGVDIIRVKKKEWIKATKEFGINIEWGKEMDVARKSWDKFCNLSQNETEELKEKLVEPVEKQIKEIIPEALEAEKAEETISRIELGLHTDTENFYFVPFDSIEEVTEFLEKVYESEEIGELVKSEHDLTQLDSKQKTLLDS